MPQALPGGLVGYGVILLLPFGSFPSGKLGSTFSLHALPSTPFWEFPGKWLARLIITIGLLLLLPFGSFWVVGICRG